MAGKALTVTVTELVLLQPVALTVSVTVYTVVTVGLTVGLAAAELNPDGDDVHEYVLPLTAVAPSVVDDPVHKPRSEPAAAAGNGLTVTVTELVLLQPVAVTVSVTVYVVVVVGLTDGLEAAELNPAGNDDQL